MMNVKAKGSSMGGVKKVMHSKPVSLFGSTPARMPKQQAPARFDLGKQPCTNGCPGSKR